MATPVLDFTVIQPSRFLPDVVGASIEGPRSLSGLGGALDYSGGGHVIAKMTVPLVEGNEHRYWSRIAAYVRGSVRSIHVPFLTDGMFPFSIITFDVNTSAAAVAGVGQIKIRVTDSRQAATVTACPFSIEGGEWISVNHGSPRFWRAYRIAEVISTTVVFAATPVRVYDYVVAISPTLRDAIGVFEAVRLWRPICTMRLMPGTDMASEMSGWWEAEPSVQFVEYF